MNASLYMNKRLENKLKEPFNIVVRLFSSNTSYSEKIKGEKKNHTFNATKIICKEKSGYRTLEKVQ